MDKTLQIPGLYIIRFQTATSVPAPFSHYDTFKLFIDGSDKIRIDCSVNYIDRDDLTEEEILEEGFTLDDDYAWKGKMPSIWITEFQNILEKSAIVRKREEKEFEDFVEIELEEDGKRVTIYPVAKEQWAYFVQELMQAVLEISGREKPFELTYLDLESVRPSTITIRAEFASKTLTLDSGDSSQKPVDWNRLQKIMDTVYRAGFLEDEALPKKPSKGGKYISPGDGMWYQMGVAVVETTAKSRDLEKIESLFAALMNQ
jgi:hypothetical protein